MISALNFIKIFVVITILRMIPSTMEVAKIEKERTIEDVYTEMLNDLEIQCPRVVVAQICLETDYLRSKIYNENHNLCGMKFSKKSQYALGVKNGHAYYASTAHSLLDYRDWQRRRSNNRVFKSDEEYLYFLDHLPGGMRYAEDPLYTTKLRNIINQLNSSSNG